MTNQKVSMVSFYDFLYFLMKFYYCSLTLNTLGFEDLQPGRLGGLTAVKSRNCPRLGLFLSNIAEQFDGSIPKIM